MQVATAIRPLDETDVATVASMLSHPDLVGRRGLGDDRPVPRAPSALAESLKRLCDSDHGAAFVVEADGIVGLATASWWWDTLTPDVHVVVFPAHQRLGHGSAAARRLAGHLFDSSPALVIHSEIPSWDAGALSFAESVGAERVGVNRRTGIRRGSYHDGVVFALTRVRWEELGAAAG